jgi:hypothetical protein
MERLEILQKVANGDISVEQADKELYVLYSLARGREPKGLINHINGTLRSVIRNNKEDPRYWQEWNIMCLKHCIGQLEKL